MFLKEDGKNFKLSRIKNLSAKPINKKSSFYSSRAQTINLKGLTSALNIGFREENIKIGEIIC